MKIVLIGATGFVGSAILKEALNRKHQVTAIARDTSKITIQSDQLFPVKTDIFNTVELEVQLKAHDAVISAYNPGWSNPDIYNEFLKGAQSIQESVKQSGIKRLIIIGGGGSLYIAPGIQLVDTPQFPEAWKAGALAARDYLNILQKEDQLEWTFLSPALEMHQGTSGERKGTYRIGLDNPVFDEHRKSRISVEDLAVAVIDELENNQHIRERFTVAY